MLFIVKLHINELEELRMKLNINELEELRMKLNINDQEYENLICITIYFPLFSLIFVLKWMRVSMRVAWIYSYNA